MLIQYGQALGDYLYDVFVAKFDFWLAFGLIAQLFFTARFLVQWISSERAGKSVVPMAFWFFSIGGGVMTLVYGIVKREPVIIIGQALATIIYIRNIMLIVKNRGRASETGLIVTSFPIDSRRSRSTSRCSDVVSIVSGRPSRRRSRCRSVAASSSLRSALFSASSLRASLTSPDMNTPKAIRSESVVRLWKAESSSAPSGEN